MVSRSEIGSRPTCGDRRRPPARPIRSVSPPIGANAFSLFRSLHAQARSSRLARARGAWFPPPRVAAAVCSHDVRIKIRIKIRLTCSARSCILSESLTLISIRLFDIVDNALKARRAVRSARSAGRRARRRRSTASTVDLRLVQRQTTSMSRGPTPSGHRIYGALTVGRWPSVITYRRARPCRHPVSYTHLDVYKRQVRARHDQHDQGQHREFR